MGIIIKDIYRYGGLKPTIKGYISAWFIPGCRFMIIKRLFNDSDWNEYAQNLTNHILIKVKQDPAPEYELYAKILPDLYEELKLTQPLNV